MRKLLILLLFPSFVTAQVSPKEFKVIVKLESIKIGEKLYLEYTNASDRLNPGRIDSIGFKEDKIVFKGKINEPVLARIYRYNEGAMDTTNFMEMMKDIPMSEEEKEEGIKYLLNMMRQEDYEFFLMPGETTIKAKANLSIAMAEGSKPVTDFEKLRDDDEHWLRNHLNMTDKALEAMAWVKKDSAAIAKMRKKRDSLESRKLDEVYLGYVRTNPASPLALYALKKALPAKIDSADKYIDLFSTLSKEIQQWPSATRLIDILKATKNTETGSMVSDFQQYDSLGKMLKFSSFKGKYVLIEFWASWCGPCRMKNPELVKTYDKYNKENFTILGVALEQKNDKEKWLKAIQKDNLKWPQVTDYKFWDNAVARQFGIQAIPFNLLVDPTGKIIGNCLYGEELDNRLAEIFSKTKPRAF